MEKSRNALWKWAVLLVFACLVSSILIFGSAEAVTLEEAQAYGKKIAAGYWHNMSLKSDGTVVCGGENCDGQCDVPIGLSNVVAVAAGENHSVALKSNGTVVCWGENFYGQCDVPAGLNDVVAIAVGVEHSMALKSNGTVVCWGYNNCNVPAGLNNAVAIATGYWHSMALKSDGTVVCWGHNGDGQCDVPVGFNLFSIPKPGVSLDKSIMTLTKGGSIGTLVAIVSPSNAINKNVKWTSSNTAVATVSDGVVTSVGEGIAVIKVKTNDGGYTATCTVTVNPVFVTFEEAQVYGQKIATGGLHDIAVRADDSVVCWGYNEYGLFDVPTGLSDVVAVAVGEEHSIALKKDGTVVCWGGNIYGQCDVPAGLSNVVAVAAGGWHSIALKNDGTVVCWGFNNSEQSEVPAGLSNVVAVAAGGWHSMALKSDGKVVCWGSNCEAPLGLNNVVAVAAGYGYSMALKSNGTVVCWGENFYGLCDVPAGLNDVVAIAAGEEHCMALKDNGMVVCWGFNDSGQCDIPIGLSNVVAIAAGQGHSMALMADGLVDCWGRSKYGLCNFPTGLNLFSIPESEVSLDESTLIESFKKQKDENVLKVFYDDFDSNGNYEAFILTGNLINDGESEGWSNGKVWFVNDKDIKMLQGELFAQFSFNPEIMIIDDVKLLHVRKEYATGSTSFLFGVAGDSTYNCLGDQRGAIIEKDGEILLSHDTYDAAYDNKMGSFSGHTWKNYYLYPEKIEDSNTIKFHEYGAIEISLDQFLEFQGAQDVINQIKAKDDSVEIKNILYRENKIININYVVKNNLGYSQNYVTVNYNDTEVYNFIRGEGGKYETAIIPEIATYPIFKSPIKYKVKLEGQELKFDQEPVMRDGRILVPLRKIFESMDISVSWDEKVQTIRASKDGKVVKMTVGENIAEINGVNYDFDVAPIVLNGRTLVPVRFIAESYGAKVDWDGDNRTVIINS
ncbi:MAG: stalk domain-containing protein [Clostridia bacterium]|nr:stalk domain-containing protein [Clostridia bacterium]